MRVAGGSPYPPGMDELIAHVVGGMSPAELRTMLQLTKLYIDDQRITELEWLAWRRAIVSRLVLPPVSMRPQ